jgi:dTDP-4-amino-4,6-dideoxygalactose transaminase
MIFPYNASTEHSFLAELTAEKTVNSEKSSNKHSHPTRPKERFLVFGSPAIEDAEIEEVVQSMRSGWLGTGPKVARFENDFRKYKDARHAVAVSSCTAALHLSMLAAGLKPGDEVITTPLTFCATVNAIIHAGAVPVLADVDPSTMNIDPEQIRSKLSKKTRVILPVHFAGRPCDMDGICNIAEQHNLKLIEDCAHAIETEYRGEKAGSFGDFGCFSFYVTKNVITGEGGMVVTRSGEDAARIKTLALHGMSKDAWARFGDEGYKHYYAVECGFKYNMMDIQAAIGIHQLRRVERYWERRRQIWLRYNEALAELPITLPPEPEAGTRHALHLYTILIDEDKAGISRDAFLDEMNAENIGTGVHYLSVPEHPYYRQTFGWRPEDYPHAMRIGRQTVSLPLSAKLGDDDVGDVITAVHKIIRRRSGTAHMDERSRSAHPDEIHSEDSGDMRSGGRSK